MAARTDVDWTPPLPIDWFTRTIRTWNCTELNWQSKRKGQDRHGSQNCGDQVFIIINWTQFSSVWWLVYVLIVKVIKKITAKAGEAESRYKKAKIGEIKDESTLKPLYNIRRVCSLAPPQGIGNQSSDLPSIYYLRWRWRHEDYVHSLSNHFPPLLIMHNIMYCKKQQWKLH